MRRRSGPTPARDEMSARRLEVGPRGEIMRSSKVQTMRDSVESGEEHKLVATYMSHWCVG